MHGHALDIGSRHSAAYQSAGETDCLPRIWDTALIPWMLASCLPTVSQSTTLVKPSPRPMPLARPIPLRLTPEQLRWLDAWRGATISRNAAIRLLLEQAIRQHREQ